MISLWSLNFPALACLAILGLMGLGILFRSRRGGYSTAILPSNLRIEPEGDRVSISSDQDIAVNGPLEFRHLSCRNLYVGPHAILSGHRIFADRIVVEGFLSGVEEVEAREIIVSSRIDVARLAARRLVLKKGSEANVQLIDRSTRVERSKGAHTRGFFVSTEDLERAKQTMKSNRNESPSPIIRVLRGGPVSRK